MRTPQKDAAVIVVDGAGKLAPGIVHEMLSAGAARIDLTPRNDKGEAADPKNKPLGSVMTQATYSENGEPGTFHYPDQTDAAKKAAAAAKAEEKSPASADPATARQATSSEK